MCLFSEPLPGVALRALEGSADPQGSPDPLRGKLCFQIKMDHLHIPAIKARLLNPRVFEE